MFRKLERPPSRSLNGLLGELYVIWRSSDPVRTLEAWRTDGSARFDFTVADVRLDVKTASSRTRSHICSYEQCNPPPGTSAVAASLFIERIASGLSLRSLIAELEGLVGSRVDLAFKLHEILADTLGRGLSDALDSTFDVALADGSLKYFDLLRVPAVREPLPAGVSDLHFRSDFSGTASTELKQLLEAHPCLAPLLPQPGAPRRPGAI
jgi:hypothetical protein